METIAEWNQLRVPTWALSYLVNSDSSGLEQKEIDAVDKWWRVFTDKCEEMGGHSCIFAVETNFEDWMEQRSIVKDCLYDIENVEDFRELRKAVDNFEYLTKVKTEFKESYFTWNPQISNLGSDVQDCTVIIVK
jgi:hypothetical protein